MEINKEFIWGIIILVIGALFLSIGGFYTVIVEKNVYNKIHNTEWTTTEWLWAKNQINSQTQTIKIEQ